MKTLNLRRAAIGAALLALAASAGATPAVPEPAIPFANHGLWVQDIHRRWYYAKLMGPCIGLNFAQTIGFDTHPSDRFDKFSSILVPRSGRCVVQSFTLSAGPHPEKSRAEQG
jgi:hypothetical protein